jgi:hypothetical protein
MAGDNVEAMRQHGIDDDGDKDGDEISANHELPKNRKAHRA